MAMKEFMVTLVRHGQTTHNKLKIIQGQMDTQLTEMGREQARSLKNHLAKTGERFDKVYASDLTRAYETCQIICDNNYNIIKNELLRERKFGVLEGSPLDKLRSLASDNGFTDENYTSYKPENGESIDEVKARMRKFCEDELFPNVEPSQSVLIVTHGGVIREFFKLFRDYGCPIALRELRVSPNTGISRFSFVLKDGKLHKLEIISLHQIPHLKNEAESEALNEEQLNETGMKVDEEHAI